VLALARHGDNSAGRWNGADRLGGPGDAIGQQQPARAKDPVHLADHTARIVAHSEETQTAVAKLASGKAAPGRRPRAGPRRGREAARVPSATSRARLWAARRPRPGCRPAGHTARPAIRARATPLRGLRQCNPAQRPHGSKTTRASPLADSGNATVIKHTYRGYMSGHVERASAQNDSGSQPNDAGWVPRIRSPASLRSRCVMTRSGPGHAGF